MKQKLPLRAALIMNCLGVASVAQASGFALIEQSASGQGLSYAGAAASVEDASVMWFNPAGMAQLNGSQAIVGLHVISPKAKFSNDGSTVTYPNNATVPLSGSGDDGATVGKVPNFYWKGQFGKNHFGVGFNVPYGQHLSYDEDWVGRYAATETDLKTYNINPSYARSLSENLQIGVGLNVQYVDVILEQKINQDVLKAYDPTTVDGNAKVTGDNLAYGYNFGLMFQPTKSINVGLSYRSQISHNVEGKVQYQDVNSTVPLSNLGGLTLSQALYDADATANVTLPAMASLAFDYQMTRDLQLLASTTWTGWSAYDELVVEFDNLSPDSESNQRFKDSMRYALGAIYQLNDRIKLRTGIALDQTPVPDSEARSPRTPDSDRKWFSVGMGYAVTKAVAVDLAYSHLSADESDVNYTTTSSLSNATLKGQYESAVDIFSAQVVWHY